MQPLPRSLIADARARLGLLTVADLNANRISGRARQQLIESGQLVRLHKGVYKIASHPDSFELRCRAACLAVPDAALSGPTAARLRALRKVTTEEIHVLARRAVHVEGVTAHRTDLLGEHDIEEIDGLRVLKPARLLCDLAAHLDETALESVLEQMIDRRMLSIQSARAMARRFVAPGRPGSVRLGRVLDSRADWLKPPDSDLELRLWRALDQRGHRFERQVPVRLDSGIVVHLDLADTRLHFGIEIDHATWHAGRLDAQRDKRRDRGLTVLGWLVSRVTDDDLAIRFAETVESVLAIVARRQSDLDAGVRKSG